MKFAEFNLRCRFISEAMLPSFKGSTFRGLFGHALKKVVCALKHQECRACILKKKCIYTLVFETSLSVDLPENVRNSSPPHPFVIEPPLTDKTDFAAGEPFDFNLLLFGDTIEYLPYFVYAFDQMGEKGIGKKIKGQRGSFILEEIFSKERKIYSHLDARLNIVDTVEILELNEIETKENVSSKIKLTLRTPLRIKYQNRLKADLPFHILVRAMLRRVLMLFNVFGSGEPSVDYQGLIDRSKNVSIVDSNLKWFDWERYSNRQNAKMMMGGLVGFITYEGAVTEFIPLLKLCEKLHVGKQTAFGLGKIELEVIS